jgi:HEAT repeat protein
MKKALMLFVALTLLWTFGSAVKVASAHGGAYRGPAGEVPPDSRDPKDPQPPPDTPGTPTDPPGPGDGTEPPGGPGTDPGDPPDDGGTPNPPPTAPGGPDAPSGPGGISTPGGGRRAAPPPMSFENWLFWWAYNKDRILNLKAAVKKRESKIATTSSTVFFGGSAGNNQKERPTVTAIREKIVPALVDVVKNKSIHADIRGGALIALARAAPGREYVSTYFEVAKHKSGEDKVVQESAIIALGILQIKDAEIRDFLIELVDNKDYPMRGRCFAMIALGLLQDNDPAVFEALERRLDGSEVHQDIPVCALLTLGLIGDSKKVPDLMEWVKTGKIGNFKMKDQERAWVVSALGKTGDPQALDVVAKVLRQKGRFAKRSAAIALGQITPQAEPKTQQEYVLQLVKFHSKENDLTAKNFALISLGRIAAAEGVTEKVRGDIIKYLKGEAYKNGNKVSERPFAVLAMGLVGLGKATSADDKYELGELVREGLAPLKGDKVALGAYAISLGMIGHKPAVPLLIKILNDRGLEKKLRGSAAMALGLIGDNKASDAIISALKEREDRDLRVQTAVAAGLLGEPDAVKILVDILDDPKASQFVLGSVALALGQIGDADAVSPLLKILEPEKGNGTYPDLTRALVAVALGQLSDRRDIRVLSNISEDINYRASVSALDEILTIL